MFCRKQHSWIISPGWIFLNSLPALLLQIHLWIFLIHSETFSVSPGYPSHKKARYGRQRTVTWKKRRASVNILIKNSLYKWFLRKDHMIIFNTYFLYFKFIKKTNKVTESNGTRFSNLRTRKWSNKLSNCIIWKSQCWFLFPIRAQAKRKQKSYSFLCYWVQQRDLIKMLVSKSMSLLFFRKMF